MENKQTLEKRFNAGALSATIWRTERIIDGKEKPLKTISLQKSYKDKNGVWQNTTVLHTNDLPKAKLVLEKAYEYIAMKY